MNKADTAMRRTQATRRDEAERRLVEATMAIIAEQGVAAATFEAIGQRAGYSRGLATQHFGSKRGLIDAVVEYLHERQDEDLNLAHVNEMSGLDGLIAYVRMFCASLRRSSEPRSYFMLLADAVANAQDARAVFAESHVRVKARLAKLVRRGQAEGCIRKDVDAESVALMVGSQLLGLSIQTLTDPSMRIAPVERAIMESLMRSLSAPRKRGAHG